MSLQETSTLPPNKIIDERRVGGCSQRRLSQLTERAVNKALKLQIKSRRLVDVVDIQSCGDPGELGCSIKSCSPFPSKLLKNSSFAMLLQSEAPLNKEAHDRRVVAAKIYSLLILWRSDVTFEWRSNVALAVPVLEEALYRVAKCTKEDFTSQHLLEPHLKNVLLHFEAGNGMFLLEGTDPPYPVHAYHSPSPMRQVASSQVDCVLTTNSCEISPRDALQWENANIPHTNDTRLGSDLECYCLNYGLGDSMKLGQLISMQVGVHNNGDNPGKIMTKRTVNMISKRRADDNTHLRREFSRAAHSEENIPKGHDGAEVRLRSPGDSESCESSKLKHESLYHGDARPRTSSRNTLGNMIKFNVTPNSGLSAAVDEGHPVFINEESNRLLPYRKHSAKAHLPFCVRKVGPMRTEMRHFSHVADSEECASIEQMLPSSDKAKQPTSSLSSRASMMSTWTFAMSSSPLMLSIPSPTPSRPSLSALETLPTCSGAHKISASAEPLPSLSSSSSPFSSLSSSSSPLSLSSLASLSYSHVLSSSSISHVPSSSSSASHVASLTSSSSISQVQSSSSSSSHKPSSSSHVSAPSSSSLHTAQIPLPPQQQIAPLCSAPTPYSIQSLHQQLDLSTFFREKHHQSQQFSVSSYGQSTQTRVAVCQNPEFALQGLMTAAASHETETEEERPSSSSSSSPSTSSSSSAPSLSASTSSACNDFSLAHAERPSSSSLSAACNDSSPAVETRDRGVRLPLSIFLAERDDYDVNSVAGMSDDDAHLWETWEEPTEQMDPLCCVCMVGLKGAAFIPCGHTFCRKCSRELWRGRGACPLCNRYIREILDVY